MNKNRRRLTAKLALVVLLVASNVLFGFPADMLVERWNESKVVDTLYLSLKDANVVDEKRSLLPSLSQTAQAANFSMQTGYYVGNGGSQSISGLGFQPQTVIIKSDTAAGQGIWKSSAMPAANTTFFSATADSTASLVTLTSGGFSVTNNANTNTANVRYTWTAFAGSDCSATGTVCVGTYTGNGANPRKITTGFQPAFVMVKRSTAVAANFRTNSMPSNVGNYFTSTAQNTTGGLFTTLVSDGFNVGSAVNNVNTGIFYYVAFKAVSGIMAEGTYSGDGLDNRSITGFGVGAVPNFTFVKNANSITTANRTTFMNNTHSYGDYSSRIDGAAINVVNMIQRLQDNGLQVGTGVNVNQSGNTIYWVAFGGAPPPPTGSGSFQMETGTYTGNGTTQSVSGLDFAPDLVVVKDNAANYAVFRTRLMAADNTAYLANAVANFTGGITSLNSDGFSIGANVAANTSGNTYQWQVFGGAYKPNTLSGAADFMIGTYVGNGLDNRSISGLPSQPDMIAAKRNSTTAGVWRSSANSGDSSSFFAATADGANRIQALNADGFQIGTNANVNTSGSVYNWFGFKNGSNFSVGNYTGTGAAQNITAPGFQPDLVWAKRSTAVNGVHRGSSLAGNTSQFFANTANGANRITALISTGFSVTSTTTETNASGGTYRYAAWRSPPPPVPSFDIVDGSGVSVSNPSVAMQGSNVSFSCNNTVGILGTANQRLRVTNPVGSSPTWSLSIAATSGPTALWANGANTEHFDFNDPAGAPSGCSDGGTDADSRAGRLFFDPSTGINTPQSGCENTTDINFGSSSGFQEGTLNSLTLVSAGSGALTGCYWDITNIGVNQYIPAGQPSDTYTLNLTLTITAF